MSALAETSAARGVALLASSPLPVNNILHSAPQSYKFRAFSDPVLPEIYRSYRSC